jgi:hypothetical protein
MINEEYERFHRNKSQAIQTRCTAITNAFFMLEQKKNTCGFMHTDTS